MKLIISSAYHIERIIGLAYLLVDDNGDIIKLGQSEGKACNIPNKELVYCNRILRNTIRKYPGRLNEVYLLVSCLKNRDISYLIKNNIGNKRNIVNLKNILNENTGIVMQTSYANNSVDQFMCQICINVSHLVSEGFCDHSITDELVDESLSMMANLKGLTAEYKRRAYLRSIIGLTGDNKKKKAGSKPIYCVMRTGPVGTKVVFVTRNKDIAYDEVVKNNLLLYNNKRIVNKMMRDMAHLNYNPDAITKEHTDRWKISKTRLYQLLEATGNGRYINYYIEATKYI